MAATVVDDAGVDSYAQQTSLGTFRVHDDCKYKNEIMIKLLSMSANLNLEAKARYVAGAFFKSYMLTPPSSPQTRLDEGIESFPSFNFV